MGEGQTLFIPSGWIHAVYTSESSSSSIPFLFIFYYKCNESFSIYFLGEDAIVFGGHFLHSFSIEKQLQIANLEEMTRVPAKLRFPFFVELLWYVLDRYVHCLVGRSHLDLPEEEKRRIRLEKGENIDPNQEILKYDKEGGSGGIIIPKDHVHLTQAELQGDYATMSAIFSIIRNC